MPIVDNEGWNKCVENNTDPYGKACVNVAREVMRLLDENEEPLEQGYAPNINTPHGLICRADDNIEAGGITGFMAGVVANIVSNAHSRGEEFRKAWNKDYTDEEVDGTVNPAVLTINN